MAGMSSLIGFPSVVNEKAARSVAALVAGTAVVALVTGWLWLAAVLAAGFALRVASGPRFDPFGQVATKVLAPRLGLPVFVAGAPKRFAQAIGFVLTTAATVALAVGAPVVTFALLSVLVVFALLESVVGFCAGCWMFGYLMRWGVVPDDVCVECADISRRYDRNRDRVAA